MSAQTDVVTHIEVPKWLQKEMVWIPKENPEPDRLGEGPQAPEGGQEGPEAQQTVTHLCAEAASFAGTALADGIAA